MSDALERLILARSAALNRARLAYERALRVASRRGRAEGLSTVATALRFRARLEDVDEALASVERVLSPGACVVCGRDPELAPHCPECREAEPRSSAIRPTLRRCRACVGYGVGRVRGAPCELCGGTGWLP